MKNRVRLPCWLERSCHICIICLVSTTVSPAQTQVTTTNILGSPAETGIASVTALVEFTGNGTTNKGSFPNGVICASDGDIYGTTERGGANDYGTIFKMTAAGALTTLIEFAGNAPANSSGMPMAGVIEARDGNFYGTTSGGGVEPSGENNLDNGTVFKLSRSGVLTTLVRFSCTGATNKGCTPYSGLVQVPNGDFYGTTFAGGSGEQLHIPIPGFRGFGTIYKMTRAGHLTTLYDFSAHLAKGQGGAPWAGLTLGRDGNSYGTTWGGLGVAGTIFKLTPTGAMTTLVRFGIKPPNKKGGGCTVELLQANDGNFYGNCPIGGGGNGGTVFKMTPSGAFTNLVEFSNNDPKGAQPHAPLAEGNDGNLYGTTTVGGAYNYGTIFRVTLNGLFKVLWNFDNPNKIHECQHPGTGPLVKDKEGNFYGTTKWGGKSDWGTVFKLTLANAGTQASAVPTSNSSAIATAPPVAANPKPEQARAEAKAGAKRLVATQPSIQAAQNEQSSNENRDEVSPESIPEAFVQAYSGADVDAVAGLYADRVDYTNSGVISNAAIRKQAQEYFARWPVRQWSLAGPVHTTSMGPFRQKVILSANYDASNPQTGKHASGIARETLILATDVNGVMKIVSQKERISKGNRSQSNDQTSVAPDLHAAKADYEASSHDETARVRYVTKLAAMLGQGMEYWWRTHDRMGGPNLDGVAEELRKHPMPRNVDSRKLSQLLVGEWQSPRHTYAFRADGTYGVADEQRDNWRIDGNEYIDDVSRGPIILIDDTYFVYAEGQGVAFYMRANDSERNQSADTNTQNAAAEAKSTSNGKGDKRSDSAITQKLLGYWSSPRHGYHIAPDGIIYMCPRKYATTTNHWAVKDRKFYWDNLPHTIVTLTDKKFVYREIGGQGRTATLIRGTKEEVDPE